jgi:DNA-binding transcriptional ArsR family regulator
MPVPRPEPEVAIRRIIAELAALHADDLAAILDVLNAGERKTVEDLLRDHVGRFEAALAPIGNAAGYDASQLSQWLSGHLLADSADDKMTPLGRQTLLASVGAQCPAPRPAA